MKATESTSNDADKVTEKTAVNTAVETTEMGEVRIHENVISALVRRAALGIDGVSRLAGSSLVDNIAEIVGSRRMQERAISVNLDDGSRVSIDVKLNVKFGSKVPVVATAVQKAIIEQVEGATGMVVTKVNVIIQELETEEEAAEAADVVMPDMLQ